jgi:predicted DNA binding CopG/RHH family protein
MKRSKRIELTENTIKYLAKKAIDEGLTFKTYIEQLLERLANNNNK